MRTRLGRAWIVLRPALTVGSQVFVFGGILGVGTGDTPYLLAFLLGFAAWHLFAETTYWSTRALELNRSLLRRLYVPRMNVLIAAAYPALVDFGILVLMTAAAVAYYVIADGTSYLELGPSSLAAPAGVMLLLLWGLALGSWLSVPGAQVRDVRFGLRFVLNFWYFFTPVIYPLSSVPDSYRLIVELNPITAPVQLVKLGLLGDGNSVPTASVAVSLIGVLIVALAGVAFFSRSEAAALDHL